MYKNQFVELVISSGWKCKYINTRMVKEVDMCYVFA